MLTAFNITLYVIVFVYVITERYLAFWKYAYNDAWFLKNVRSLLKIDFYYASNVVDVYIRMHNKLHFMSTHDCFSLCALCPQNI